MPNYLDFTEEKIRKLKPSKDVVFYRSASTPGWGLKVAPSGVITFIAEARVNGKSRRKALRRYDPGDGRNSIADAKAEALATLANFAAGVDVAVKKDNINPTLLDVFEAYLKERTEDPNKPMKPTTAEDYRKVFRWGLGDWKDKNKRIGLDDWASVPIRAITEDMVVDRHRALSKKSLAQADYAMRILRAVSNFAAKHRVYKVDGKPLLSDIATVDVRWNKVERRQTVLKPEELKVWYDTVLGLTGERSNSNGEVVSDFFRFLLFTGMRPGEAGRLDRAHVDLQNRSFSVEDTKNRTDIELPMSDPVWDILAKRMDADTELAFTGPTGGPLGDLRYWVGVVKDESGIEWTTYDLRRTFTTVAARRVSHYHLKRLLTHKISDRDVTGGYVVLDVEELRKPAKKVAKDILKIVNG